MKPFTYCMGGEAGYGIASSGLNFAKIVSRSGYYLFNYFEYPSLIRGGHNVFSLSFSDQPVFAPYQMIDFLVALNQETIDRHLNNLLPGGSLILDTEVQMVAPHGKHEIFDIPLTRIAKEVGGAVLLRDMVALGASMALLGGEMKILKELINEEFDKKGEKVKATNYKVAEAGYDFVKRNFSDKINNVLTPLKKVEKKMIVTGNEAAAVGAVAAGLQFAAIYPMTPTSNILHVLAPLQEKYGFVYKQPEDEISAINMAIGAAYAGARSMVATSGGGFCLMTEGFGLAGITETPVVIIEGMRGGPATGLPTWTEQGDLRFVLHAHQSDFPRIVLAPGDAKEIFDIVMKAFNLAEKYQTPVVFLVDKHMCESNQNFPVFNYDSFKLDRGKFTSTEQPGYQRYAFSIDGVSLRAPVGSGNLVIANSDEHDEQGYTSDEISIRRSQMEKRMMKLETCAKKENIEPVLYGPEEANLTIVSWGSTKGVVLEALKQFDNVNFLHLNWLSPFPYEKVASYLRKAKKIVNIEGNYSAQLNGLIAEKTGMKIEDNVLKYDGRPFFVEEIITEIRKRI